MLYNINGSVPWCVVALVYVCVCAASVSMAGFSQSFFFFFRSCLSFLPSWNTSLHHSSKTPPLLVSGFSDWHAAAYFPQWCLLCPVVLCSLCLSHVSIFRMTQWYIYCLLLPRHVGAFFSFSYDRTSIQNRTHCVHWMNDKLYIKSLHYV